MIRAATTSGQIIRSSVIQWKLAGNLARKSIPIRLKFLSNSQSVAPLHFFPLLLLRSGRSSERAAHPVPVLISISVPAQFKSRSQKASLPLMSVKTNRQVGPLFANTQPPTRAGPPNATGDQHGNAARPNHHKQTKLGRQIEPASQAGKLQHGPEAEGEQSHRGASESATRRANEEQPNFRRPRNTFRQPAARQQLCARGSGPS